MRHHVEIDQNIEVEQTNQPTVLAFSNGIHGTILIPAEVKRACQRALRDRGVASGMIMSRIFVAGLVLLLENQTQNIASVTIDPEYEGREGQIKGLLLRFVGKWKPSLSGDAIAFRPIGKKSAAHKWAWETHRGECRPDHIATLAELLRYC
jgi:hypothetical protein